MSTGTGDLTIRSALVCAVVCALGSRGAYAEGPAAPVLSEERLLLETDLGDVVLVLFPQAAPLHVQQVLALARLGVYDGTHFHRVAPGFYAQLGVVPERATPLTPKQRAAIRELPAEPNAQRHVRGALSMARNDERPNSATTSFLIMLGAAPRLDGTETVFGRVEHGFDTLNRIERAPLDGLSPQTRIHVRRARVLGPPDAVVGHRIAPVGWALVVAGLAVAVLAGRRRAARVRAAALLILLVGLLVVFMAALWARADHPLWGGLVVMIAAPAVFRILATFEGAPARDRA